MVEKNVLGVRDACLLGLNQNVVILHIGRNLHCTHHTFKYTIDIIE